MDRFHPHPELVSHGLCLADPGRQYVVYLPGGGDVTVRLPPESGMFEASWHNPRTCGFEATQTFTATTSRLFTAPDSADWVLYLRKRG